MTENGRRQVRVAWSVRAGTVLAAKRLELGHGCLEILWKLNQDCQKLQFRVTGAELNNLIHYPEHGRNE
jgi:hypothetical protein